MIHLILAFAYLFSFTCFAAPQKCPSANEYISTLTFLRTVKIFQIPEAEAQKIAEKVASGCALASSRFAQIIITLTRANVPKQEALSVAIEIAQKPDPARKAFLEIFDIGFSDNTLDLDNKTSLALARGLSSEFKGDHSVGVNDFKQALDHCLDGSKLNLPRIECAKIALSVAKAGEKFETSLAQDFKKLDQFIRAQSDMDQSASQAAQATIDILELAPGAADNFITAYQFALAEKGLKLHPPQALTFAKKIASQNH